MPYLNTRRVDNRVAMKMSHVNSLYSLYHFTLSHLYSFSLTRSLSHSPCVFILLSLLNRKNHCRSFYLYKKTMSYFACRHRLQLWTLLLSVLIQIIHINAKFSITPSNGNITVILHSYDFFLYREPYYQLSGIGLDWGVTRSSDGSSCRFKPFNNSNTAFTEAAKAASPNINLAVVVEMFEFFGFGCTSRAKVSDDLS